MYDVQFVQRYFVNQNERFNEKNVELRITEKALCSR